MRPAILLVFLSAPTVLLLTLFVALNSRRRLARGAEPAAVVRTASLNTLEVDSRGWRVGMFSTLILLAGTATLLALHWSAIPARFPVHWRLDGHPDGWAGKSFGDVFGPLLLSFFFVCGLGLLGELMARSSPGFQGRPALIRTMRTVVLACSWLVTVLLCLVSVLPLFHTPADLFPFLSIGAGVCTWSVAGYIAFRAIYLERTILASQNSTEGRFWKAGLLYFNPQDSAIMVPKRQGFGYTLNFGRPVCWVIFALLLVPLLLPFFLHVGSHH